MAKKLIVNQGDKYGRLTIIEEVEPHITPSGQKQRMILCSCDCGTSEPFEVTLNNLRSGHTTSCGCVHKEKAKENGRANKKYNKYDLTGEYGIGYTSKGEEFYFDKEDFDLIKDYCWSISNGYVVTYEANTGKQIKFHRLIMNYPEGMDIDHSDHKTSNNCKSNLRVCSHSENMKNKKISNNNTSSVTGVSWHKARSKWRAYITINGKTKHLGFFINKEEAIEARLKAELELYGTFSPNYEKLIQQQSNQQSQQNT